jgi:uncharacterized damage-inducible protein DinB
MPTREALLPEFDQEMAATRLVLERLPEAAFDWRPHPRSYSLGELGTHLAQIPHWGTSILMTEVHELAPSRPRGPALESVQAVLERFDRHVHEVRSRLVQMIDAELQAPWALRRDGHLILSMPRIAAIRSFVVHHMIHHRGQLTVYLRHHDVPLPALYGPTADEQM